MKILSVGNFGTGWDGSICDEEHIAKALEELGHEVTRWQREDVATDVIPGGLEELNYDFTLIAQWDGYGDLARLPKPLVYWAFDYQEDNQEWHKKLRRQADLYLSKSFKDSRYPNWRWLSQDFAPDFLKPHGWPMPNPEKRDIDVLFTGSWVPWESGQARVETLKAIDQRYNLTIHSATPDKWQEAGFKRVYGPLMDEDLIRLIARTKINLSMDHVYAPGYWSDRNAQIMACGGLVLFKHVPFSEAIFRDHVFYFYDTEDCLQKIEKLLKLNYNDYDEIGKRNYQYAYRYLSARSRVQDLLTLAEEIL